MPNQRPEKYPVAAARAAAHVKTLLEELNQSQTVSSSTFSPPATSLPTTMSTAPRSSTAGLGITAPSPPDPAAYSASYQQLQQMRQREYISSANEHRSKMPMPSLGSNMASSPMHRSSSSTPSSSTLSHGSMASPRQASHNNNNNGSGIIASAAARQPTTTAAAADHANRLANLRPDDRLCGDIPQPQRQPDRPLTPRTTYVTAPTRGAHPNDTTGHIPGQAWVSARNLPVGLGLLEQPTIPNNNNNNKDKDKPLPLLRDPRGTIQLGVLGQPLYELAILGDSLPFTSTGEPMPGTISTAVEPWRVAMWLCYDARVTLHDVTARMRIIRSPEQLRAVEKELGAKVVEWCEQNAGMVFHRRSWGAGSGNGPAGIGERDVRLVGELGLEKVTRNCVWELWKKADGDGMLVTQPGGSEYGTMWPAIEKVDGKVHGTRTAMALWEWERREAERKTGLTYRKIMNLVEEVAAAWLMGSDAPRERPTPADVLAVGGGDVEWALKRWNVVPAAAGPVLGYRSPYSSPSGFSKPFTAQPGADANTGSANNVRFQQPGLAGNAGNAQPAVQSISQPGPQMSANGHFPRRYSNTGLPDTAQHENDQLTIPIDPALFALEDNSNFTQKSPATAPQGAATSTGGQQPSSVSPSSLQPSSSSSPSIPTSPAPAVIALWRHMYGHLDTQALMKQHADASERSKKEVLWHLIQERRRQEWDHERSKA